MMERKKISPRMDEIDRIALNMRESVASIGKLCEGMFLEGLVDMYLQLKYTEVTN